MQQQLFVVQHFSRQSMSHKHKHAHTTHSDDKLKSDGRPRVGKADRGWVGPPAGGEGQMRLGEGPPAAGTLGIGWIRYIRWSVVSHR